MHTPRIDSSGFRGPDMDQILSVLRALTVLATVLIILQCIDSGVSGFSRISGPDVLLRFFISLLIM